MLDLSAVDLGEIATALEDHSFEGSWWIDADTGEVWYWRGEEDDDPELDPDGRDDARHIDPLPSGEGYADMVDFIALVPDHRAADLLDRAIAGRGAFRRFKDTLFEFPELREEWFRFRDTRMQRRAIEFLVDERLVDEAEAERALAGLHDPQVGEDPPVANPREVAAAVAADLRRLYGERLVGVVLYGSQARGDAHPDSDVDLAGPRRAVLAVGGAAADGRDPVAAHPRVGRCRLGDTDLAGLLEARAGCAGEVGEGRRRQGRLTDENDEGIARPPASSTRSTS